MREMRMPTARELMADAVVHALGLGLGVIGAVAIVIVVLEGPASGRLELGGQRHHRWKKGALAQSKQHARRHQLLRVGANTGKHRRHTPTA